MPRYWRIYCVYSLSVGPTLSHKLLMISSPSAAIILLPGKSELLLSGYCLLSNLTLLAGVRYETTPRRLTVTTGPGHTIP